MNRFLARMTAGNTAMPMPALASDVAGFARFLPQLAATAGAQAFQHEVVADADQNRKRVHREQQSEQNGVVGEGLNVDRPVLAQRRARLLPGDSDTAREIGQVVTRAPHLILGRFWRARRAPARAPTRRVYAPKPAFGDVNLQRAREIERPAAVARDVVADPCRVAMHGRESFAVAADHLGR